MGVTQPDISETSVNRNGKEAAENNRTEEMNTGIEDKGEHRAEERRGMCSGTQIRATQVNRKTRRAH